MKRTQLLLILATLAIAGCATPLGPSDNFNDWTQSASYHHYQQYQGGSVAPIQADDGRSGE